MVDKNIVEKIKKLLAVARGKANKHESEVAIAKAQELMIKHNLSMELFEDKFIRKERKLKSEYIINNIKRTNWWVKSLSNIIAYNFRCEAVLFRESNGFSLGMIGLEEDVAIASITLKFALESCKTCADKYIDDYIMAYNKKTPFHLHIVKSECKEQKKMFIRGFVDGVKEKLEEQIRVNNWGLMLVKDELLEVYIKNKTKSKSFREPSKRMVDDIKDGVKSYKSGFEKGKMFDERNNRIES